MTAGGPRRFSYGPVPSRRLGKSLGINNIPAKICSYACVYCQVGPTTRMQIERTDFYDPRQIHRDVEARLARTRETGEPVDFLTFVPDGEPTLDRNLVKAIELLKPLGVPVAVITNATLMGQAGVREALSMADWVSLKVDAVQPAIWRKVNRPSKALQLSAMLSGMLEFAADFAGTLATETMLVAGLNESEAHVREIGDFLQRLRPAVAYLSVPTRPPAEKWVRAPDEKRLNRAYQLLSGRVARLEYLIGYEGDGFASTGDIENDILSIAAVHPLREGALTALLARAGGSWQLVERLLASGELAVTDYRGHRFYLRSPRPVPVEKKS